MNPLTAAVFAGLLAVCFAEGYEPSYPPAPQSYGGYPQPQGGYPQPNPPSGYPPQDPYPNPPASYPPAAPSGYGPPPAPNPYYGHGYSNDRYVEELLDRLDNYLDNLELKDVYFQQNLMKVIDEANTNLNWKLNYENTLSKEFAAKQKAQDQRLDALDQRVAEIAALRQKVADLQADAVSINNVIENGVYPSRKEYGYDISDLENMDIERISQIEETKGRADAVNDRIDVLFEKAWDNTRDIDNVYTNTKRATLSVNRQRGFSGEQFRVDPTEKVEIATTDFGQSFDGVPQGYQFPVVGFHFKKSGYAYGYPALYFGTSTEVWDMKADTSYVEMSAGGWDAQYLVIKPAAIFYDTTKLGFK